MSSKRDSYTYILNRQFIQWPKGAKAVVAFDNWELDIIYQGILPNRRTAILTMGDLGITGSLTALLKGESPGIEEYVELGTFYELNSITHDNIRIVGGFRLVEPICSFDEWDAYVEAEWQLIEKIRWFCPKSPKN